MSFLSDPGVSLISASFTTPNTTGVLQPEQSHPVQKAAPSNSIMLQYEKTWRIICTHQLPRLRLNKSIFLVTGPDVLMLLKFWRALNLHQSEDGDATHLSATSTPDAHKSRQTGGLWRTTTSRCHGTLHLHNEPSSILITFTNLKREQSNYIKAFCNTDNWLPDTRQTPAHLTMWNETSPGWSCIWKHDSQNKERNLRTPRLFSTKERKLIWKKKKERKSTTVNWQSSNTHTSEKAWAVLSNKKLHIYVFSQILRSSPTEQQYFHSYPQSSLTLQKSSISYQLLSSRDNSSSTDWYHLTAKDTEQQFIASSPGSHSCVSWMHCIILFS